MAQAPTPADRKKRTITEIRDSKQAGEKMVYTSVLDYTSAKWAETAGVDVCVVGDSLAMTCHGHPSTIPATMDMMVLHATAVRRGAPNTFVLGCMPYQSYHTVERALTNATRFMQDALCDAVKPQGGKSQSHILKALVDSGIPTASHIGLTPHTIAMFGGFKIQGRTADAAMKILEDALAIQDAGCFMLEFEAVPAKIAKVISRAARDPDHRHRCRSGHRRADPAVVRPPRRIHRLQAEIHQALREPHRGRGRGAEGLRGRRQGGHVPRRRPQLWRGRQGVREIPRARRKAPARVRARAAAAETLTDRAYTALEEMIVRLELPPGGAVSEAILSERLGIGRTPIREALQRLARERLVQILPRRGVIVSDINVKAQLRLLEVRREIERLVARSAARRATPEERSRFAELAKAFERAARTGDDVAFLRIDREFNELCLETARNEFATTAMQLMASLSRRFWYLHYKQAADMPETAKLHADIARGIAGGQADAAGRAADALLDNIETFTRNTVSTDF